MLDTHVEALVVDSVDWWPPSSRQRPASPEQHDAGSRSLAGRRAGVHVFTGVALSLTAVACWVAACLIVPFPS